MPKARDTTARRVHAVLAAALADPALLERWRRNPAAMTRVELGGSTVALDRVWRFAGLATKVRHNDVRLSLPMTFRLLDVAGLSIEVFASYAKPAAALRKAGKRSRLEKIDSFLGFLNGWLDRDDATHARVWDLIRHERAILELQERAADSSGERRAADMQVRTESVPAHPRLVIRHEMGCNPVELARMLRSSRLDIAKLQQGRFYFAYRWDDRTERVNVLLIDETAFVLLELVDGSRSVAEIAALLFASGIPVDVDQLLGAVQELVNVGLLSLDDDAGA